MKGKMRLRDRILLCIYALIGIIVTAYLLAVYFGGIDPVVLDDAGMAWTIGGAIVGIVLLTLSIRVFLLSVRREPKIEMGSVAVQNTENGSVRISEQAIETLVRRAIGDADGIVEMHTNIVNHDDSISVNIEMTLESDVHIPNVTMLMQHTIKKFIEEFSGIAVREVTVLVTGIVEVTAHPPLALPTQKEEAQPGDTASEDIDQDDVYIGQTDDDADQDDDEIIGNDDVISDSEPIDGEIEDVADADAVSDDDLDADADVEFDGEVFDEKDVW